MTEVFVESKEARLSGNSVHKVTKKSVGIIVLYLLTFALLIGLFIKGYSYYITPYVERAHHPDYRTLRPAGSWGLTFGVIGSAMMILMLVYSLRKRARWLDRIGSLPSWLKFHIYLGIVGPFLILLHTSFKVQGLVAVSFWSMVVVALSGYFGRYLYIQIPRNIQGNELSLQELQEIKRIQTESLKETYNLDEATLARIDKIENVKLPEDAGLLRALFIAFKSDLISRFSTSNLQKEYAAIVDLPKTKQNQLMQIARERAQLQRRVELMDRLQQLFHYWHVIHKPFAIIMYVVMVVHILVAVWTGYARIF